MGVEVGYEGDDATTSATGSFTIRVNTPPAALEPMSVRVPWKTDPIPFTLATGDADPLDIVSVEFLVHPTKGFITGVYSDFMENGRGWALTSGRLPNGDYALPVGYHTISSTFTGFDTLTYRMHDMHGGVTEPASVSIEVFED